MSTPSYWVEHYWICGNCGRQDNYNHSSCSKCGLGVRPNGHGELQAQLTALEAENQELVKEANHDIEALEAENQKLREFLTNHQVMWCGNEECCNAHNQGGKNVFLGVGTA